MKIRHEAFDKIIQKDNGESFAKMVSKRTLKELIKDIDTISDFSNDYGYSDFEIEGDIKTGKYKFIGDLFEIFAEAFFLLSETDNRIGVFDYKPVFSDDDNGVDGYGKNIENLNCTIQIKYRGNPTYELKERDIKQFPYQSIIEYDIDNKRNDNMIIFTNCKGIHWYTKSNVFGDKLRVINGDTIAKLIDNNEGFWIKFKEIVLNTIKSKGVDKLTEAFLSKMNN